jgi:hypothetical protein
MKQKLTTAAAPAAHYGMLAALLGMLAAPVAIAAESAQIWTLDQGGKGERAILNYGTPESDETTLTFSCIPRSGKVRLFVGETSDKLKPGDKAKAILAAGGVKTQAQGKILANEMAGVPSFEGVIDARDALFSALAPAETLAVAVGPSQTAVPLKGLGDKAARFAQSCAKP